MVRKNSQQCLNVTSQITNSYLVEMIDLWSVVSVENVIANKILKYKYNIQPMNEQIKIWINEQLKEQILSSSFNYINRLLLLCIIGWTWSRSKGQRVNIDCVTAVNQESRTFPGASDSSKLSKVNSYKCDSRQFLPNLKSFITVVRGNTESFLYLLWKADIEILSLW